MNELRIVTPQEAYDAVDFDRSSWPDALDLLHTVATEPDRTRAAVVKALREFAASLTEDDAVPWDMYAYERADAIENGAPFDA